MPPLEKCHQLSARSNKTLTDQLHKENLALKEEIDRASMFENIVEASDAIKQVLAVLCKVAPADSKVLIAGETGTGKELAVRAIHKRSRRASCCLVAISVRAVAIPAVLLQVEPGGHPHERLNFLKALGRIHHLVPGFIFLNQPVNQSIHFASVFGANAGWIVIQMLEMIVLFEHRRFIDVVIGGHAVVVRVFRELPDVSRVVAADIHAEKNEVRGDRMKIAGQHA